MEYVRETVAELEAEIGEFQAKLEANNAELVKAGGEVVTVSLPQRGAEVAKVLEEATPSIDSVNGLLESLEQQRDALKEAAIDADKKLKKASAGAAASEAAEWLEEAIANAEGDSPKVLVAQLPGDNPALLQEAMNGIKARQFPGVAVLALVADGTVHVGAVVHADFTGGHKAGDLVRELTAIVGGKGGGKPEMARGAGRDTDKVGEMLEQAKALLGG
jgi:alanyl-tRNA synthetase